MSAEGQLFDRKSLRHVQGKTAAFDELAKDCVAFANAQGGNLHIGIENGNLLPPEGQRIDDSLLVKVQRRLVDHTVNVSLAVQRYTAANGSDFLEVRIVPSQSIASTTDGRFYLRVGDTSRPLLGEEMQRLLNERTAQPWETLTTLAIPKKQIDQRLLKIFTEAIRSSERVKAFVKEKSDQELLDHYYLTDGKLLTNLGILLVGKRESRAKLGTAPAIQFIKYDIDERKVNKICWDDYSLTPIELVDAVWNEIPDFQESYELPEGLLRRHIPAFDKRVIRELLVNALVHRPYTQRGDIYLNLHPDRLEVVNPGLLPLGVTPQNILHQSVRRNSELARVFYELHFMEREGSGFDKVYEVLTSQGRSLPCVQEGVDFVSVTISRRVIKPEVIDFLEKAERALQMRQRERIVLGILAQHEALSAQELSAILELANSADLHHWMGRLQTWNIVRQTGRTSGTRYFVDPNTLRQHDFPSHTTLQRIEPHRLNALILEDIQRHPHSSFAEMHDRIGKEILHTHIRKQMKQLFQEGKLCYTGANRWRRYWVPPSCL